MNRAVNRGEEEVARFDNVGLRYGTDREVLSDLSFTLFPGRFYFLTGASGAGKTSLLKLLYLAQRFEAFLPKEHKAYTETMNWLFWQMGSAPYLGGGFGHFYAYAPFKMEYPINRFAMEVKRQMDVLDRHLTDNQFMAGDEYSIADMAIWPWYGSMAKGVLYDAAEFLSVHEYTNVIRWADEIGDRPAVKRGRMVNRTFGDPASQLHERHDASDFDTKTQDKVAAAAE